ncbi:cytochrome c oxidase assembly protein [Frateuria sp. GZRe14]|uniref:cytochrome c oxidase assembly protein n=1 Tax=Frateuria sp. GZRe14 TaxID=3351534 RepID=UPI003EDC4600
MKAPVRMAVAAWAAASFAARAHGVHDDGAAPGWTFDGWVVGPLLVGLAWYAVGYLRLRQRSTVAAAHHASAGWFIAGWLVLAAALVTPLHEAGERSFAAHMVEHELLMLVAAPLLVLSRPIGIALWAFPQGARRALAAFGRGIGTPWRALTAPATATLLQAAALWLWHAPRLFDLALANPGWHIVQHLSFLLSALLFWWAVLRGHEQRVGVAVGCLFFTATVSGALGALMAFSSSPWYAGYASSGLDAFGLTPAEDQQLAGLLMWIPGGLVHAFAGLALFARRLGREGGRLDAFD